MCVVLPVPNAPLSQLLTLYLAPPTAYCSGDGWVGNQETVKFVSYNGSSNLPLYFRGGRNVAAAFDHLIRAQGFGDAEEVILSGDSAGGLACYSHADSLQQLLPKARVLVAPDSGYFFHYDLDRGWPEALVGFVAANGNATAYLNQACVAARAAAGAEPLDCILPEVAAPHIPTPLFVFNSKYDPALLEISASESGKNVSHTNRVGAMLVASINATVLSPPNANAAINAAFMPSCFEHCGQWGSNQSGVFPDFRPSIDGATGLEAFATWRTALPPATWPPGSPRRAAAEAEAAARGALGEPRRLWVQEASYPCKTCCQGGQQ